MGKSFHWGFYIVCSIWAVSIISNLISGQHGLVAWQDFQIALQDRQATLTDLQDQENRLLHDIELMQGQGVDLDLLDERTRAVLGLALADEHVIFLDDYLEDDQ